MIARQVGEYAAAEAQSLYSVLHAGMRAHLHKCVVAPSLHHFVKQPVEREVVWGCLLGWIFRAVNDVFHRREQSGLISHEPRHLIEQRGSCGLSVSSCHTHEVQLCRGVVKPLRCQVGKCDCAVGHLNVCHIRIELRRHFFTHHHSRSGFHHVGNEFVGIYGNAFHSHKHCAWLHRA